GTHFPPSDPQWKGKDSSEFLAHAAMRIRQKQCRILHLDITVIGEAPKISPHRDVMKRRVADILGIHSSQVSVKATTTEKLGFTGREEGLAAQAVTTVLKPLPKQEEAHG
ncbi:MAG: 2-C-methyl-D-erythritol 2,4-cyclodiphosphate synthase, partial [Alphaproteobacteria bacterium]|nr:2-C-methyl-D-erythritol 2,4-cyclodiphosphate synthase [Alphaproteobacteria bacterium]